MRSIVTNDCTWYAMFCEDLLHDCNHSTAGGWVGKFPYEGVFAVIVHNDQPLVVGKLEKVCCHNFPWSGRYMSGCMSGSDTCDG